MSIVYKQFAPESFNEVQDLLDLRKQIFTDEQGIPAELDEDGKDPNAWHVGVYDNQKVIGVGRLVRKQKLGVLARIGVVKRYRGQGIAGEIVRQLESIGTDLGIEQFELYPHAYLEDFYSKLGYRTDHTFKSEVAGHSLLRMMK